ncbi:MAG: hypothetical protein E6H08_06430 [Bacteroidetes bacterium]|jgi:hypothetical protein|nr:MAG: hypothetical protein E6H08_06430 [Bacteroidota bacterium]
MKEQNFKNHSRYIILWTFITPLILLAILGGSIVNLILADTHTHYSAALILLISVVLIIIYWYARVFALKAQDRAIRAEENLRHFILTGKPFDRNLRLSQIIALRFAPDDEFPELAKKAIEQKLSSKEIKTAIQKWKADHHRV